MVFLQAAARRDSVAAACLRLAEEKHVELCLSPPILSEIHDVLSRPQIRSRFTTLNDTLVKDFLTALSSCARIYPEVREHVGFARDPNDEPYLNLAIEAQARYLASRDNDLLDLRNSGDPFAVGFRQSFPTLQILEPLEFLREIRRELIPNPQRGPSLGR